MSSENDWYILSHYNAESNVVELNAAGIPCYVKTFTNGRGKCLLFPAEHVKDVLKKCGYDPDTRYEIISSSDRDHVYFMDLYHDDDKDKDDGERITSVLIPKPGSHFEAWDELVPVIQAVYDQFGTVIKSSNPHGSVKSPIDSGSDVLHVHFYAVPIYTDIIKYETVFGYTMSGGQCDGFVPTNRGESIKDDGGRIIAEIVGNNLYILFDLPHTGGNGVTEIFTKIMKEFYQLKGKTKDEIDTFLSTIQKAIAKTSRRQFVNSCDELFRINIEQLQSHVEARQDEIDIYNKKLVELIRDKDNSMDKLIPLQTSMKEREKWANKEFDALMATPKVIDVVVNGKIIHIFTDRIDVKYNGVVYRIGKFRLDIYTDGSNEGVRAFNLTNSKGSLGHPHIRSDGHCCLGNISEGVTKLIAEYQYVVLTQLMLNFLQSYSDVNPYGSIKHWSD